MSSLYFQISGLFTLIIISIVYFSKKRVDNLETRLYSILLIVTFFALFFDISIIAITYFVDINDVNTLLVILNKFYLSSILLWIFLFTSYIFNVSFDLKTKNPKLYNIVKLLSIVTYIISVIVIFILPIYLYDNNNVKYSFGPSINFLVIIAAILILLISSFVLLKIKDIRNKKYTPVYTLILIMILAVFINQVDPGILITTFIMSYNDLVMFFTIENPDLKMINELNIAKELADKANLAKSEFLSHMSHEIRTPLNAIMGFSQSLEEADIPQSAKEDIKDIKMASNNLLEIVNGILDISKIEAGKLEIINTEYNVKKLLDEIVILAKGRLGEKPLDFRINFDQDLPQYLNGDHTRLKQVIINLLTNAIKYTNEGYIDFRISAIIQGDVCRLIISVEDSGIGIPKEKIDKLFTKFERAGVDKYSSIEGTGLGLAITKKLVELMNGQIVVQSEYGIGSKFTVAIDQMLVTNPTTEKLENTAGINLNELQFANKKILVVDDNKLNLKVASKLLSNYSVQVEEVSSGQECIDKIKAGNRYDLILMDDMMPKMSGVETLKELVKLDNFNMPVVALTANAIVGMREKYIKEGFNDYLAKPIEKNELSRVIKKFLK